MLHLAASDRASCVATPAFCNPSSEDACRFNGVEMLTLPPGSLATAPRIFDSITVEADLHAWPCWQPANLLFHKSVVQPRQF